MEKQRPETFLHQSPRLEGTGVPGALLARMLAALRRHAGASAVTLWVRRPGTEAFHLFASDPADLPLGEPLPETSGPVRRCFEEGAISVVEDPSGESGFDHPPLILDRLRPKVAVLMPVGSGQEGAPAVAVLYLREPLAAGDRRVFDWTRWAGLLDAFLPSTEGAVGPPTSSAFLATEEGEPVPVESLQQVSAGLARRMMEYLATITPSLDQAQQLLDAPEPALRFVRYASEGLDRLTAILHRLMTFGGGGPLVAEMVRIPDCVSEAMRRLEPERSPHIRLLAELPRGLPPVMADRVQVVAACQEVMRNGLEAAPDGTEVRVTIEERDEGIEVVVKDEGPGMSGEVLHQATRPFFSTRRPDRHPGLGLSSAQGILQRHGGQLTISSRTGAGTTVRLWFPSQVRLTEEPGP